MINPSIMNLYCSKFNLFLASYLYTIEFSGIIGVLVILLTISAIICSILFIFYYKAYISLKNSKDNEQTKILHLSSRNRELLHDISVIKDELDSIKDESGSHINDLKKTIDKLFKYSIQDTDTEVNNKDIYLKKYLEAKKSINKLEKELFKEKTSNKDLKQQLKNLKSLIEDIEYKYEENIHNEAEKLAVIIDSNINNKT